MHHDTTADKVFLFFVYVCMALLVIVMLYPFWERLVMSLSTSQAALRGGFRFFTWPLNLEGYKSVFRSPELGTAFLNTLFRVVAGTAWTVILTALMAYPLSREDLPFNGPLTFIVVLTMWFSGGLIPEYLLRKQLHLLDTRAVLILPGIAAYYLVIVRNFFRGVPAELREAAQIDGATDFILWWRIMMPLSKPILATVALWSAVGHWNAYFDALIYINDRSKYVLQVILRRVLLENELQMMKMQPGPELTTVYNKPTPETIKAALLIITVVPIVMIYPFAQRYFIKGILQGSIKG